MSGWHIGIIGGSGLYDVEGIEGGEWIAVDSPWGQTSDSIFTGRVGHARVSFLPRHGRGHWISPWELNNRANIDCLKRLGVTDVLAVSSVGGLTEERAPGTFSVVDQFIDRTKGRPSSFFGSGMVAHVSMADPVCPRLSALAAVPRRQPAPRFIAAAPIWRWRGRNSRPGRKANSTAAGVATSSA